MPAALPDVLFVLTAAIYFAATVLFVVYLSGIRLAGAESFARIAPRLVAVGCALHATHIVVSSLIWHVCPVEGVHFAMSVVSMLACATYVAMRLRYRIDIVGAFVTPFALTFLLASRFVPTEPSTRIKNAILPFHIAANLAGTALFTLAFASAVAYLVQEHRIKQKRLGGAFQRLPPLDALDRAEHTFLLLGFPLLTIGILTGTVWARRAEVGGSAEVARAWLSYASWLMFALVLLLRAAAGWRGRRAAYGTIAGFGLTVLVLLVYVVRGVESTPVVAAAGTSAALRQAAPHVGLPAGEPPK
jgi:ABC-type uncharacterized transport system permease subunit